MANRPITHNMIEAGLRVWVQYEDLKIINQVLDGKVAQEIVHDIYKAMAMAEPKMRFEATSKKGDDVVISNFR